METMHRLNIIVHVIAGSLALITGILAAIVPKRERYHVFLGRFFTILTTIVIVTGLVGVFVFKRNLFLLVITLLSGYNCYSGFRAIRLRGRKPVFIDYLVPLLVMAAAVYYLWYLQQAGLYWAPVVTYSTTGALFMITLYDLSKFFLPVGFLKKAVLYEHVYKMMSAVSALASAFAGTVFPQYKPYSQFLPSVVSLSITIAIFIWLGSSLKRNTLQPQKR